MKKEELYKYMQKCVPLADIEKIFKKKSFLCSIYFLKYYYENDVIALAKYYELFDKLNYDDKVQALANIFIHLENTKNIKDKEKQKVKK